MKFIKLVMLMLLTISANAQNKIRPYLVDGYFFDLVRETRNQIDISGSTGIGHITLQDANANGFFTGIGVNNQLGTGPVGIQLEAVYDQYTLSTTTVYYDSGSLGTHRSEGFDYFKQGYVKISPSVTYGKFTKNSFSYLAELGLSYSILVINENRFGSNYAAAHAAFAAGYGGVLLRLSYEYGLGGMFKDGAQLYSNKEYWQIKSNRISTWCHVLSYRFL